MAQLITPAHFNNSTVETYRVPFADLSSQQVGFFVVDNTLPQFDAENVVLVVQSVSTADSSGTTNVVTPSNVPRGAVTALITVAQTFDRAGQENGSIIESISLRGDGGSIQTQQTIGVPGANNQTKAPFTAAITSTGPLGDVILSGPLPSVTAPSIFGSLLPSGSIPATSTIQTTGIRTDPITSATSQVAADIGRIYVTSTAQGPVVTTSLVQANSPGLAGQIICGGNLISQVIANGGITGEITVQAVPWEPGAGNLGTTFTYPAPSSNVLYLGGVVSNGAMSGPAVAANDNVATIIVNDAVQGGVITTYGSVIGNITINGPMSGPTVAPNGNVGTVIVNGTVQGGFITTYGSVIGNITINGPVNGPSVAWQNNEPSITINAPVQGGFIDTAGSVSGNITINGSLSGPIVAGQSNDPFITINSPVHGGSIITSGSVTGNIKINGSINGPIVAAPDITQIAQVQGGSILTGGTQGNVRITGGLSGEIVSIGDIDGTVYIGGNVQGGAIATSGSVNGNLTIGRSLNGQLVAVGNINGNVAIYGSMQSGRIACAGLDPRQRVRQRVDRRPERHRLGRVHRRPDQRHHPLHRRYPGDRRRSRADQRRLNRQRSGILPAERRARRGRDRCDLQSGLVVAPERRRPVRSHDRAGSRKPRSNPEQPEFLDRRYGNNVKRLAL